jgi:hypothetical protein
VLLRGSIAFSNAISPHNRSLSRLVMKYTISALPTILKIAVFLTM